MKIYILFFGITRSLSYTIDSIRKNVIGPAKKHGDVSIFCHFFKQEIVANKRSGEYGALDLDEYKLLNPDWITLESPENCLKQWRFEKISQHGDVWNDDYISLKNLIRQLHSLYCVTESVLKQNPDLVIYCRPDLRYHNSFNQSLYLSKFLGKDLAMVPPWQAHAGVNDRFSIVVGERAIRAYGLRILKIHDFLEKSGEPLHSERLLKFSLNRDSIRYRPLFVQATRIRLGGIENKETFSPIPALLWHPKVKNFKRWVYGEKRDSI